MERLKEVSLYLVYADRSISVFSPRKTEIAIYEPPLLTYTTLMANSAHDKLVTFSYCPRKQD